ncbi:MAG TPA: rRNA maturation RNase YbeY [Bryobacteraceae bacterium]|nr:rRNA maturation RNase YbeY [Bryobacteraceae bacterium]
MPTFEDPLIFLRVRSGLSRRRLRELAKHLAATVGGGRRFTCLLTDDRELRRLNRQFLGKDYPTDVLSFPEPGPDDFLGEMAISVERAAAQAREYGHAVEDEIGILLLHGLLHLTGMDHETDRGRMARAEKRWRKALGLPAALVERARRC